MYANFCLLESRGDYTVYTYVTHSPLCTLTYGRPKHKMCIFIITIRTLIDESIETPLFIKIQIEIHHNVLLIDRVDRQLRSNMVGQNDYASEIYLFDTNILIFCIHFQIIFYVLINIRYIVLLILNSWYLLLYLLL